MKTFFSLIFSFFCVLTISQAQSLDSSSPLNPELDFLKETVSELFADAASVEEMAEEVVFFGCKCKGDINRDGNLNLLDVEPFVTAVEQGLNDPCADMNGDGSVNLLDVAPFIKALEEGGCND